MIFPCGKPMGPEKALEGIALYLRIAEQCEHLAERCASSFYRDALLDAAAQWRKMAEQSEADPTSLFKQVSLPRDLR
jgi:hypothetical protein